MSERIVAAARRVRRFVQAAQAEWGHWQPPDLNSNLQAAQVALFRGMSRADQRHSIAVWQMLKDQGVCDPHLLQAALLHDVGKTGSALRLGYRVAVVLLEWLAPGALARLAVDRPGSWRHPFLVHLQHPQRGAEMVRATGAPEIVIELIRMHHAPAEAAFAPDLAWRLEALRRADGQG